MTLCAGLPNVSCTNKLVNECLRGICGGRDLDCDSIARADVPSLQLGTTQIERSVLQVQNRHTDRRTEHFTVNSFHGLIHSHSHTNTLASSIYLTSVRTRIVRAPTVQPPSLSFVSFSLSHFQADYFADPIRLQQAAGKRVSQRKFISRKLSLSRNLSHT